MQRGAVIPMKPQPAVGLVRMTRQACIRYIPLPRRPSDDIHRRCRREVDLIPWTSYLALIRRQKFGGAADDPHDRRHADRAWACEASFRAVEVASQGPEIHNLELAYILLLSWRRRTFMLADLLIGLTLWTATSVLAAISLGRILQRAKLQAERRHRPATQHPLSDVA